MSLVYESGRAQPHGNLNTRERLEKRDRKVVFFLYYGFLSLIKLSKEKRTETEDWD